MSDIRNTIFKNIGAASMCWSEVPKGIFNSTRAEELANEIFEAHQKEMMELIERLETSIRIDEERQK